MLEALDLTCHLRIVQCVGSPLSETVMTYPSRHFWDSMATRSQISILTSLGSTRAKLTIIQKSYLVQVRPSAPVQ